MTCSLQQLLGELARQAPLTLAEPWDNVGLLVEPHAAPPPVRRVLLTIDLTGRVWREAERSQVDGIIAYHPPIFSGLKRLRASHASESLLVAALRSGTWIFSPHTALDAAAGGMNDWLASALGPVSASVAIIPVASAPTAAAEGDGALADGALADGALAVGAGRRVELCEPLTLDAAIARLKHHLGLSALRVAAAEAHAAGQPLRSLAVCPGAGGAVFERLDHADLLVTGEMRHHDVLARARAGCSVIFTDHTNSERGFLPVWAARLSAALPGVEFMVAREDADPLRVL